METTRPSALATTPHLLLAGFSGVRTLGDELMLRCLVRWMDPVHPCVTVLSEQPEGHRYLLPDVCLSDDGRFLDGMAVAELPRVVEVIPTDGIALRRALERAA